MGCSKNYIMYWGVFTLIIVPFSHSKVCTNFQKNSLSFYSICIVCGFYIENTAYFLHKRMTFWGLCFGLTILSLFRHDRRACDFSRYQPAEPATGSFLRMPGCNIPGYKKKDSHRSAALLRRRYFYYGV